MKYLFIIVAVLFFSLIIFTFSYLMPISDNLTACTEVRDNQEKSLMEKNRDPHFYQMFSCEEEKKIINSYQACIKEMENRFNPRLTNFIIQNRLFLLPPKQISVDDLIKQHNDYCWGYRSTLIE